MTLIVDSAVILLDFFKVLSSLFTCFVIVFASLHYSSMKDLFALLFPHHEPQENRVIWNTFTDQPLGRQITWLENVLQYPRTFLFSLYCNGDSSLRLSYHAPTISLEFIVFTALLNSATWTSFEIMKPVLLFLLIDLCHNLSVWLIRLLANYQFIIIYVLWNGLFCFTLTGMCL